MKLVLVGKLRLVSVEMDIFFNEQTNLLLVDIIFKLIQLVMNLWLSSIWPFLQIRAPCSGIELTTQKWWAQNVIQL